ncbi:MAG: glycosyltransferase [Thermoproteaceae archaeon]|nr:glycosyltransferase [Thermoproteaceae archaeon]
MRGSSSKASPSGNLISIVIPVKNERYRVRAVVEGLHRQAYRPVEVIFVDGGSTDGTAEEVANLAREFYRDDFRVRLLRESDFGPVRSPANARNIGALNASGEYLAFFDADFDFNDDPEAVCKIAKAFREGANHVAAKYVPNAHTWIERNLALDDVVHYFGGDKPVHVICAFRRELFLSEMFNPELGFREDFEFLDRLGKRARLITTVVDTSIRRCYPHSTREFVRQQLWYGRTAIRYYRLAGVNALATLVRSNAVLGLTALAIVTAPALGPPSSAFLLLALALIYLRWLRRDVRYLGAGRSVLGRLAWYLFRETVGRLSFDAGFLMGLIKRGGARAGR